MWEEGVCRNGVDVGVGGYGVVSVGFEECEVYRRDNEFLLCGVDFFIYEGGWCGE